MAELSEVAPSRERGWRLSLTSHLLSEQKQSAGEVLGAKSQSCAFLPRVPALWEPGSEVPDKRALSRRLGRSLEGSGGRERLSAQGWPQHLSSSFEAWKLPGAATAAGQMGLPGSDSWGGRGQQG